MDAFSTRANNMNRSILISITALGLGYFPTISAFYFFPNPAIGTANLVFDLAAGDYSMTVYNTIGQVMESKSLTLEQGLNSTSVNTTDWSAGIYVVEMRGLNQVVTTKFLKQ